MKRALLLIIGLTVVTFGCGWQLDSLQHRTAQGYLVELHALRQTILDSRMDDALRDQAYLHALWQQDAHWLNLLIDHHHTRDVNAAMRKLATALEEQNPQEALLTLDDVINSMEEVAQRDMLFWENIM